MKMRCERSRPSRIAQDGEETLTQDDQSEPPATGAESRAMRSVWSFFSGVGASLGLMLMGLLATPVLLRWLGDERLGAFRTATDWGGYLLLLDLGLGGALQAMLAGAVARGDRREVASIMAVGIRSYLVLTALMIAVGLGFVLALPWLIPLPSPLDHELRIGFGIGLLVLAWTPLSPFRALAEASQRGYLANGLILLQSVVIMSASLLLAWLGWGIAGQYLGVFLGAIPFFLILACDGLRRYPEVLKALRPNPGQRPLRSTLWALNGPTLLHNLCGRVGLFTDNIVICFVLGPAAVVPFFLSQRLVTLAGGQVLMVGNATWAALAELDARGERERLNERLIELTQLTAILGLAVLLPTALFTRVFVGLWVGADRYGGDGVAYIAAANAFLLALLSLWGWVFSGTGKVALLIPSLLVATAVNLAASIVGTYFFGLVGPLVGTLVGVLGVSIWWIPLLLRRHFGTALGRLFAAAGKPLLLAAPFAVALHVCSYWGSPEGWVELLGAMAATSLLFLASGWVLIFSQGNRAAWQQRLRGLLGKGAAA